MFNFLKKKLKNVVSSFSKKIDEQGKEEVREKIKEAKPTAEELLEEVKKPEAEKKEPERKAEEKKKEKPKIEEKKPEPAPEIPKEEPKPEEKKGFFGRLKQKIVTKKINEQQFDDLFWDLEVILLENNVAVEVIEKIKQDLKQNIVDKPLSRTKISRIITDSLKQTIDSLFDIESVNLLEKAKQKKPLVICFVGINGSGKTTTIAKIAKFFEKNRMSCIMAASDTFRAAAIDQLQKHADNLGIKLIKHDYGSDAAAVAFDAIKHAKAKGIDVVLIDTAGRIHSNVNLMDELKKIVRVAKPDLNIFIGESITGNDCTEQARKFNEAVGIDGIILTKLDVDEKGGATISASYVTKKPILFIGTGQSYNDLKSFDPKIVLKNLGF